MSSETSGPVAKWILIAVSGISMLCIVFFIGLMTYPAGEYRAADELQARGFGIRFMRQNYEVWQRPILVLGEDQSITEDDSRLICQLSRLQSLTFRRCDLSELNLDDIGNCRELRYFYCDDVTQLSVNEIRKLAVCPVYVFMLKNAPLNDSDLESFMKWTKVEYLYLENNPGITDAGFEHLEKITPLRQLDIKGTSVTKEGVEEFQRKRPDVTVAF
jgi:hypothetical protein